MNPTKIGSICYCIFLLVKNGDTFSGAPGVLLIVDNEKLVD